MHKRLNKLLVANRGEIAVRTSAPRRHWAFPR